jgi:hypothetical protein
MGDDKYYPDHWREYCSMCKSENQVPDTNWAIFAGRFRMAGNFGGGTWFSMGERSVRGYDAAIRLLLSYSAFEAACAAAGTRPTNIKLEDPYLKDCRRKVRTSFKSFSEEDFPLRNALSKNSLKKKIDDFFSGDSEDLLPFASAIRHLFAHGVWTPKGSQALSKQATEGLDEISHALKLKGLYMFEEFYNKINSR